MLNGKRNEKSIIIKTYLIKFIFIIILFDSLITCILLDTYHIENSFILNCVCCLLECFFGVIMGKYRYIKKKLFIFLIFQKLLLLLQVISLAWNIDSSSKIYIYFLVFMPFSICFIKRNCDSFFSVVLFK